jgi:hypothetical protein
MIFFRNIGKNTNTTIITQVKDIYLSSFPSSERIDFEYLILNDANVIQNQQKGFFTLGIFDDDNVIGLVALYISEEFIFILYFAVINNLRGVGIGGISLHKLFSTYHNKIFVLEIEYPNDEISKKRINFYKKNAVIIQDFDYLLPPLQEDNPLLPMLIGTYPRSISQTEFKVAKQILYNNIYHYFAE